MIVKIWYTTNDISTGVTGLFKTVKEATKYYKEKIEPTAITAIMTRWDGRYDIPYRTLKPCRTLKRRS